MKNLLLFVNVFVFALLVHGTPTARGQAASAPTNVAEGAGTYTTYVGGQQFGAESYTVKANADGSRRAEADASFTGAKFKAVTVFGPDNRPLSFETETNGAKTLAEEFTAAGVKVRVTGQPERVVAGRPKALLENGVWHHFIFLLAQYDAARGGRQSFEAFLPSQALAFNISLERDASPSFDVKGRRVATEHWRAATDLGLAFEIWADVARTPLVISIPAQTIKVVRGGSEELAEVILPSGPAPGAATSPDAPYTGEEVEFTNGEQKLAGTLTLPKAGSAPFPAAVIITGSGSQDRDGKAVANLYRLIAERLSSNGVAVLRVDDRGAGRSSLPAKPTSYRDLVGDSRAAFEYVLTRREIDKTRVALVGHSEGAETAALIAAGEPRVAAVALLAGTSSPMDRVVIEQALFQLALAGPVDPSDRMKLPAISRQLAELFEQVKASPKPEGAAAAADQLAWFREHAENDPLANVRRVRVPVLILNGERDALVLPHHAVELARALAESGNKRTTLRIFPNLTHIFTPSGLDASARDKASEVSPEVLNTIQTWFADVFKK